MNLAEQVAAGRVAPGCGILAADESLSTTKKRFDVIGAASTADNRCDYRKDGNGKRNEIFAWQAGQEAKA
jgi:fructose-bisphosphate aldolase class I